MSKSEHRIDQHRKWSWFVNCASDGSFAAILIFRQYCGPYEENWSFGMLQTGAATALNQYKDLERLQQWG